MRLPRLLSRISGHLQIPKIAPLPQRLFLGQALGLATYFILFALVNDFAFILPVPGIASRPTRLRERGANL
jgi:hypothetical protein